MEIIKIIISFLSSMLQFATPIILAGLGGVICENAGVVNIALEGMMRMGGFFAVLGSYITSTRFDPILGSRDPLAGNPWIGILLAIIIGILAGLLHGYISISLKGNQIVSGVAINVFALGGMTFFLERYFNTTGHSPSVNSFMGKPLIPILTKIPIIGELFRVMNIFVWLALILPFVLHFFLYNTPWGLRLRAVGEHPKAADTLGIDVYKVRYFAVIMSGIFAALAGASMSIGQLDLFDNHMPAGLGFIALAAMIFGKWKPIGTLLAALFFMLANVVQIFIQTYAPSVLKIIPRGFFLALPYILTILILAGFVGKATAPAADGVPYEKGEKL
ncbi:MAG TPA: ABC transporter permease [Caldisericia bacterium]|nr:ABC transporter permease [Caldisericia bacterium]